MILHRINSPYYTSLQAFAQDFGTMFKNAMTYNVEGSEVYQDAFHLQELFNQTLQRHANSLQRPAQHYPQQFPAHPQGHSQGNPQGYTQGHPQPHAQGHPQQQYALDGPVQYQQHYPGQFSQQAPQQQYPTHPQQYSQHPHGYPQ